MTNPQKIIRDIIGHNDTKQFHEYYKKAGCKNCGKQPVKLLEYDSYTGTPIYMCPECMKKYK